MRTKSVLLVLVVWCVSVGAAGAYVFDALDVSSKARGMGGAWTAGADDATALFYNPACLVEVGGTDLTATYLRPNGQDFESLTFLGAAAHLGTAHSLGLSWRKFGVEYGGRSLLDESTLSLGHGLVLLEDIHSALAVGYALNVYVLEFGRTEYVDLGRETTYGIDLGLLGTLRERTRIGFVLKNVNEPSVGKVTREPLPQWMSAGVSYAPYYGVVTELDLRKLRGEDVEVHMGMQFGLTQFLDLRFGFQTGPNSLTGGFTARIKPLEIDYAYSSHSVLPGTHHLSVRGLLLRK